MSWGERSCTRNNCKPELCKMEKLPESKISTIAKRLTSEEVFSDRILHRLATKEFAEYMNKFIKEDDLGEYCSITATEFREIFLVILEQQEEIILYQLKELKNGTNF